MYYTRRDLIKPGVRSVPLAWLLANKTSLLAASPADTPSLDHGNQKVNSNEVSTAYQKHLLHGIRWALGLVGSDSKH